MPELRKFHLEIGQAKPVKQIKSKSRFLCLAVNHVRPEKKVEKKTKTIKKKQLGKRKLSKDEKKLLKKQKKNDKKKARDAAKSL